MAILEYGNDIENKDYIATAELEGQQTELE
jgi:hypothetical protein